MAQPSPKSLTLDLLATLRRGAAMPVGALVAAGELFGISGNSVRVAVARLMSAERIVRDERGRYRMGERSMPVGRRVRSWRDLDRRMRPWRGGWIGVHPIGRGRVEHRGRDRAFRLLGFRALRESLWLRPDNLSQSVPDLRGELRALGLPESDLVFGVRDLDPESETHAHDLWDTAGLRRAYRTRLADIEASAARLETLTTEQAMVESFLVGGRVVRALVLDPLLPDAICASDERRQLVDSLRSYDRVGRLAWAKFLKRHGVPYLRAPLDTRLGADAAHAVA